LATNPRGEPDGGRPGVNSIYVRTDEHEWVEGYPGVEIKTLYEDPAQHLHVSLMRYRPGAFVPRHRHTAVEHIFVLEGVVEDEDGACEAGNYALRLPGCVHSPGSRQGALSLAIAYGPTEPV